MKVQEATFRLEVNLTERISLPDLAQDLDIDYRLLRREFKRAVGLSMGDFRLRQRIDRAQELLLDASVSEVAEALGYPTPFTFSAQFKHFCGFSPSRYQQDIDSRAPVH